MEKSRRSKTKYPALKPELNLKTRYELIDYDYINKLSHSEKEWLNKFTEEYVNASLNTENPEQNLHNTEELKKDCYRRNNARNRDILTRAKASGNHISTDELLENKKTIKVISSKEVSDLDAYLNNTSSTADDDGDNTNDF